MPQPPLNTLLVAPETAATRDLAERLGRCTDPVVRCVHRTDLPAEMTPDSLTAFDVLLLDIAVVPNGAHLRLSPALHALPVVLVLDPEQNAEITKNLPAGVVDYISRDTDDAHAIERILYYTSSRFATMRSLEDAEEQLRSIVEGISDGILIVDGDESVLFANPAAESVLHRPLLEMLGAPIGFPLPDTGQGFVEVLSHRHDALQLDVNKQALRWEGREATLVTIRDVTAQSALEDNLRRAKEDAERVANLKTAFLANMSHELRMPLASIIGFAQLITDGQEDPEITEFSQSITEGGNRLLDTINSVLDLTRLDADVVESHARFVACSAVAREAVGMLAALAARKSLPVSVEESEGDDTVYADPTILRRILANLIGNAIKFTDEGSVRVRVVPQSGIVQIRVKDTGRGIDADFIPQLFDEFTQESSGFDRSHEGSGLGLAITKRLCGLIGGRIDVDSEKGVGSTFTVTLPHAEPDLLED